MTTVVEDIASVVIGNSGSPDRKYESTTGSDSVSTYERPDSNSESNIGVLGGVLKYHWKFYQGFFEHNWMFCE